jgi:hypothetical protein
LASRPLKPGEVLAHGGTSSPVISRHGMKIRALDHIVLCVNGVTATRRFYERVLNMESREDRPGK